MATRFNIMASKQILSLVLRPIIPVIIFLLFHFRVVIIQGTGLAVQTIFLHELIKSHADLVLVGAEQQFLNEHEKLIEKHYHELNEAYEKLKLKTKEIVQGSWKSPIFQLLISMLSLLVFLILLMMIIVIISARNGYTKILIKIWPISLELNQ